MIRTVAAIAAVLLLAGSAHAQGLAAPHLPGRVSPTSLNLRDPRLPAAESSRMVAEVERLLFAPLLVTPALAQPQGFAIGRQLILAPPPAGAPKTGPTLVHGHLLLRAIDPARSKPDAAGAYNGVGEGPAIQFTINDPGALYPWPGSEEGRESFFDLDPRPAQRSGFPVLRFRSKDHIVIAKPGRKPYRHVSKREVLEREIGDRRGVLAKLGADAAPVLLREQADQEAELAALSPTERASPACLGGSRKRGTFTPCSESGAMFVVAMDPGYFDPALPRTAIQLITLIAPIPHRDEHKALGPVTRAAVEAMDLAALQRALR